MNNYLSVLLSISAFLSFSLFSANSAQAQFGFSFGSNTNKLTEVDEFTEFENAQGWHIEIWFDAPAGPMELRPGLRYVSAGSIFEVANDAEAAFRDDTNIGIFEIPIDFRFRFNMDIIRPFVALGPILRFPTGGGDDVTGMKSMHVAGGFGVGLELRVSRVILYPELKYVFGITPFLDSEFQIAQRTYRSEDNQLLNGFMVRFSVGL
ncbi:MAG: PorT family protein [Rhodothermaceae bacterium]|nr:PorT family protein [Rhodothermaceae bacterium]